MATRRTRALDRAALGAWVRSQRELQGWTQSRLAEQFGVSQAAISWIEQGQRALAVDRLQDLCNLFGVDLDKATGAIEAIARQRAGEDDTEEKP